MKKILAVFMAVLMTFTCFSVAVMAEGDSSEEIKVTAAESNEPTTRNIMNEDGLVIPLNFTQLKQSFIFKIIEKIIKFILSIFGATGDDIDNSLATGVSDFGDAFDEGWSNLESIAHGNN